MNLILALLVCFILNLAGTEAQAAPPVRISVQTSNGSGIEQAIVDRISDNLQNNQDIVISTVNPDWFVLCSISENIDPGSGSIRYNGEVTVKTKTGHLLNRVAVQKYNQDFSVSGGGLNKKLIDNAAREVIASAANRTIGPIQEQVIIEMETRERIIQAQNLGDQDQYNDALAILRPITPDTAHFQEVRALIGELEMELDAYNRLKDGEARASRGRYTEAINLLKDVNPKSKRFKLSRSKIASYRAILAKQSLKKKAA